MNIKDTHRTLVLSVLVSLSSMAMAQQSININGVVQGKNFDGIGIVNGGGATSVLLKDYPEPQRSQIMDMVYKPMWGASVSGLLVEIPGDGNSTQGSMPSHSHYRGDFNYHRGYMWWVIREAKKRNPQLLLDGTAWSMPSWVGNGNWWSDEAVDYYISWLQGLRNIYGIEMDALGCHNEKGTSYEFIKSLKSSLKQKGFGNVKLHGFDNWGDGKMDFLKDMRKDPELAEAFDAVSAHTFSEIPMAAEQRGMAEEMGKPIWNSEDHIYKKGFDCLIGIVKAFNDNYIVSGATRVINWYDIAGVYPLEPYSEDPPMILAREPWSGNYTVRQALWGYAHYGQFTQAGWAYIESGCKTLDGGGSMVTLKNPQTNDYSIIIETKDAKTPQAIRINIGKGLKKSDLCLWRSNETNQFEQMPDIKAKSKITLTLEPNSVYSLSTTRGQQKGCFSDIPTSKSFPLPYEDNFDEYAEPAQWGYLPHYTADLIGAFELVDSPRGKGLSLRQVVGQHTNSWAPEWHHYTILGDSAWTDYSVSARVYLNPNDEAGVMGRLCEVGTGYGIWAKGYYMKIDDTGKCSLIITRGKLDQKELIGDAEQQALIASRTDVEIGGEYVLDSKQIEGISSCQWHELKLSFEGHRITGYVDGKQVVQAESAVYGKGMAGLIAPLHGESVSTPYFDDLHIEPLGRSQVNAIKINKVEPLYLNR